MSVKEHCKCTPETVMISYGQDCSCCWVVRCSACGDVEMFDHIDPLHTERWMRALFREITLAH